MTSHPPSRISPLLRAYVANARFIGVGVGALVAAFVLRERPAVFAITLAVGALVLVVALLRMLRLAQHEKPEEAHPLPTDLPIDDRLRQMRSASWLVPLILAPYSAWVAFDLFRLETGQVAEIQLWGPIGGVYRVAGFWPAVLLVPALLVAFAVAMFLGIRRLSREALEPTEAE